MRSWTFRVILAVIILIVVFFVRRPQNPAPVETDIIDSFSFSLELVLPGSPEQIYYTVTGDISGWWDHTYSENPAKLYIDPKPGGGFWEIFDDSGDGVRHAVVIAAQRGKLLRFEGPLGLAGNAVHMVHTFTLTAEGSDSTQLVVAVNAAGDIQPEWPKVVQSVWRHFLFERLQPYVEMNQ